MPYIESLSEFQERMKCKSIVHEGQHLFGNGARSNGRFHLEPPEDEESLLTLRIEFYDILARRAHQWFMANRNFLLGDFNVGRPEWDESLFGEFPRLIDESTGLTDPVRLQQHVAAIRDGYLSDKILLMRQRDALPEVARRLAIARQRAAESAAAGVRLQEQRSAIAAIH